MTPLKAHKDLQGKIEVVSRKKVTTKEDLSIYYTPGVAMPCLEIEKDESLSFSYTRRGNLILVVSDGSAVLGLGNIGSAAAMPVMEGKAMLFKEMGDVDAIPLVLNTNDEDEIVNTIKLLEKNFSGVNLEDISAPRCFNIEKKLKEILEIPVFHDDQHGTAIILYAALYNALKLANKKIEDVKIVINGAGAAGLAISQFLIDNNAKNIIICDIEGVLDENNSNLNTAQIEMAKKTNPNNEKGLLKDALVNADVFIGVSVGNILSIDEVNTMNDKAILFPLANPISEISYEDLQKSNAFIYGTGSSKYPNQINNLLAFPGIFKGALNAKAKEITKEMMQAASLAIASYISPEIDKLIPDALDKDVHKRVSEFVEKAYTGPKLY